MNLLNRVVFCVLCVVLFLPSDMQAQDLFFLNQPGKSVEYSIADAKGKVQSYSKSTVKEIKKKDAKNYTIVYSSEVMDSKKKSLMDPMDVEMVVVDGVIQQDPVAAMGEAGKDVKIEGNYPVFPSELSVGQDLGDYSYTMKMMGVSTTTKGGAKVTAKENITTPAGTFDCYKVESTSSTKAMFQTTKINTTSWYAKGIGVVRSETADKKGKVQTVQELVAVN